MSCACVTHHTIGGGGAPGKEGSPMAHRLPIMARTAQLVLGLQLLAGEQCVRSA